MNIVFFDGVCNLCNSFIDWLIRHDQKRILKYASLQGATAAQQLKGQQVELTSVIYLRNGEILRESTAVLMVLWELGGPWRLTRVFLFVPPFIRDRVYGWIARNRYQWFGQRDTCRLPTPEEKAFFLP